MLYIPKRKLYIEDVFKNSKFKVNYILGPDKNNLDKNKLIADNIINKYYYKEINKGRIACHLGHIEILKKFLNSDCKYAFIFEDDIKIEDYYQTENKINIIKNNLPEFDIIYFDYCCKNCKNNIEYNEYFNYSINPLCRHFYLVSKEELK